MTLHYSLLDESTIRYRRASDGETNMASLPELFIALLGDQVHDFPALRPHQRHPWHAFLVQLAAIAMHRAHVAEPFATASDWRQALLALTPEFPDGAAWCLVSPPDRAALLQAPVLSSEITSWKNELHAADEIDMLITSKNHDLKTARLRRAEPDDWLYALISLQSQEGFLGAGNYGVSRMNGGFASRPAVGAVPKGGWGKRWARDVRVLLETRQSTVDTFGFRSSDGIALLWLVPWNGVDSVSFSALDPHYIEICRRVRLSMSDGHLVAKTTGSKAARINAKERNGVTGDAWTPVDIVEAKALTVASTGFHYRLTAELLFGNDKWQPPVAQRLSPSDGKEGLVILAQTITRGQGKTEGYHERRIPISPRTLTMLQTQQTGLLGKLARRRIEAIGEMRRLVWGALCLLFNNGNASQSGSDSLKDRASRYALSIERTEDQRFFDDLSREIEAADPEAEYLQWLVGLAERCEKTLRAAFVAGPRSGMQRYRAQSAALNRFHGALRGENSPIPILAGHYRQLGNQKMDNNSRPEVSHA